MSGAAAPTAARLLTGDGLTLEALWQTEADPDRIAVVCHAHPLHGGAMTNPFVVRLADELSRRGFGVLRFNFRGTGGSEGSFAGGNGETADVDAAVREAIARHPGAPLVLTGWSFGAAVALRWHQKNKSQLPYVGIAPPVTAVKSLREAGALGPAARAFVVGDRDRLVDVEDLSAYAASIGAEMYVLEGCDHFFLFREDRVAAIIEASVAPIEAEQLPGIVPQDRPQDSGREPEVAPFRKPVVE